MLFEQDKKNRGHFNNSIVLQNAPYESFKTKGYEQAIHTLAVPFEHPQIPQKNIIRLVGTTLSILGLHTAVWYGYQIFHEKTAAIPEPDHVSIEIVKPPEPIPPKPEVVPPKVIQPKVPPMVEPKQSQPVPKPLTQASTKSVQTKPVEPVVKTSEPVAQKIEQPVVSEPAPAKSEPVVTEAKGYAGYMSNPAPEYPEIALDRGWEGKVILRVKVSTQGHPLSVEVKSSSGRRILDDTALKTVKKWVFAPAMQGSTPVEGWVDVPMNFKLPKES